MYSDDDSVSNIPVEESGLGSEGTKSASSMTDALKLINQAKSQSNLNQLSENQQNKPKFVPLPSFIKPKKPENPTMIGNRPKKNLPMRPPNKKKSGNNFYSEILGNQNPIDSDAESITSNLSKYSALSVKPKRFNNKHRRRPYQRNVVRIGAPSVLDNLQVHMAINSVQELAQLMEFERYYRQNGNGLAPFQRPFTSKPFPIEGNVEHYNIYRGNNKTKSATVVELPQTSENESRTNSNNENNDRISVADSPSTSRDNSSPTSYVSKTGGGHDIRGHGVWTRCVKSEIVDLTESESVRATPICAGIEGLSMQKSNNDTIVDDDIIVLDD